MANKGFIRSVITDMMEKRGIDVANYDEAYVDDTLTTKENIANIRNVYHLEDDLEESQHAEMKKITSEEEWAEAQKQPEENDELPGISFAKASFFGSKASEGGQGRYASKVSKKKEKRGFMERTFINKKTGMLKQPKKPGIARYIPKPIQVAREHAVRSALGIPQGFNLNPVTVFRKENAPSIRDPLFGNVKVDAKGRRRLF